MAGRSDTYKERAIKAYQLRFCQGWQVHDIAQLNGCSLKQANSLIRQGAAHCITAEVKDEARSAALNEIDYLRKRAYEYLDGEYVFAQFGKIVLDDNDKPLKDIGPNLAALDRILKLEKRRAEIFGYDAPKRASVNVITEDVVDAEIRRLTAEMEAAERQAVTEAKATEVKAVGPPKQVGRVSGNGNGSGPTDQR